MIQTREEITANLNNAINQLTEMRDKGTCDHIRFFVGHEVLGHGESGEVLKIEAYRR